MELDVQRFLECNKDPAVVRLEDAFQVIAEIQAAAREELLRSLDTPNPESEFDFRLHDKKEYEKMDLMVACSTVMSYVWEKRTQKVRELYGKQEDSGHHEGSV